MIKEKQSCIERMIKNVLDKGMHKFSEGRHFIMSLKYLSLLPYT